MKLIWVIRSGNYHNRIVEMMGISSLLHDYPCCYNTYFKRKFQSQSLMNQKILFTSPFFALTARNRRFQEVMAFSTKSGPTLPHSSWTTFQSPSTVLARRWKSRCFIIPKPKKSIGLLTGISELGMMVVSNLDLKSAAYACVTFAVCEDAASWWTKTFRVSSQYKADTCFSKIGLRTCSM